MKLDKFVMSVKTDKSRRKNFRPNVVNGDERFFWVLFPAKTGWMSFSWHLQMPTYARNN